MGVAETVASDLYETVLQCGILQIPWIGLENTAFSTIGVNSVVNAKVLDDLWPAGFSDASGTPSNVRRRRLAEFPRHEPELGSPHVVSCTEELQRIPSH